MRKLIVIILVFFSTATYAHAQLDIFQSNQVGSTPVNTYILQTDGTNSTWIDPTTLGTGGGGGADSNWVYSATLGGFLRLASSTNRIGIGTSSPYAKLSVVSVGAATTTLALVPATNQTADLIHLYDTPTNLHSVFTSAGRLGIGTTTPGTSLGVMGAGVFAHTVTASNFTATSTTLQSTFPLANITKLSNLTSNGFVTTSGSDGTLSVDTTAYTPTSRALTIAGTAGQITSSAGSQNLSADRTWTLSLPSHVIFPGNFQVTNSTTTNATTTNIDVLGNLSFNGEIQPDGATCANGEILKKAGTNDWDCAADATSGGGGSGTVATSSVETANFVPYWTSTAGTPALLGSDSGFQYSASTDVLTILNASSTRLSAINGAAFGSTATSSFSSTGVLTLATALAATSGGTGLSSYTAGDMIYATTPTTLTRLASSTGGTVLMTSTSTGAPTWVSTSTLNISGGGGGSGTVASGLQGQNAYYAADGTTVSGTSTLFFAANQKSGFGTTSPWALVSIQHPSTGDANPLFVIASSTASTNPTLFVVHNNGNIGIGTSTPSQPVNAQLNVRNIANNTNVLALYGTAGGTSMTVSDGGSIVNGGTVTWSAQGNQLAANSISFNGNAVNTIQTLNSSSAAATLVIGGGNASSSLMLQSTSGAGGTLDYIGFKVGNNGSTEAMRIIANGNVGIGTTSPYAKLSVVGDSGVVAWKYTATSTTATSTFAGPVSIGTLGSNATSTLTMGSVFNSKAGCINIVTDDGGGVYSTSSLYMRGSTVVGEDNACR